MNFIIMFRIKTLAQIGEQCDRVADYLNKQGRIDTELKVYDIYYGIFGRVLDMLGVTDIDEDNLDWILEEPLIVGVDY